MENIFVAIITGGLALVGVIITNVAGNRRAEEKLRVAQAITDAKIEELTREVRKHNNFAEKIPVILSLHTYTIFITSLPKSHIVKQRNLAISHPIYSFRKFFFCIPKISRNVILFYLYRIHHLYAAGNEI